MSRHPNQSIDHQSIGASYSLVFLGGGEVGKTALLKRFLSDEFVEKHRETVEDLHTRIYNLNGQTIRANILDTAGHTSFPAMRRLNIGHGNAFVLVYSVASNSSFQDVKDIFAEIKSIRDAEFRSLPIVIAANKCDLPSEKWEVTRQQVDEFMLNETLDCHAAHLQTSAKTDHNVLAIFETLVRLSSIPKIDKPAGDQSSNASKPLANGVDAAITNNNVESPARRFQKPPPYTRRFSLQAFNLSGIGNASADKGKHQASPLLDMRKGSVPAVVGAPARKPSNGHGLFHRRQKAKSNEDVDVRDCIVQ